MNERSAVRRVVVLGLASMLLAFLLAPPTDTLDPYLLFAVLFLSGFALLLAWILRPWERREPLVHPPEPSD